MLRLVGKGGESASRTNDFDWNGAPPGRSKERTWREEHGHVRQEGRRAIHRVHDRSALLPCCTGGHCHFQPTYVRRRALPLAHRSRPLSATLSTPPVSWVQHPPGAGHRTASSRSGSFCHWLPAGTSSAASPTRSDGQLYEELRILEAAGKVENPEARQRSLHAAPPLSIRQQQLHHESK